MLFLSGEAMQEQVCEPPDYQQVVMLLDGEAVLLRPIRYTDRDAILALFDRCSPETRFLRYHYTKTSLTDEELEHFCKVDYFDTLALVAEMQRPEGTDIVGVGRYLRLPSFDCAEPAFVVEDKEQGKGIGTHLLRELATLAKARGINHFVAEVVSYNVVMLDIFRKYDPGLRREIDGSSYQVTLSL
jgi:RimJ/RimL family protein N-acetyltransferase